MSTQAAGTQGAGQPYAAQTQPVRGRSQSEPRSTETKASFKTTEFLAYLFTFAALVIAGAVVDESDAGGFGARQVWLYVTILTVGYMISRGLAKAGSREPIDSDGGTRGTH